MGWASGSLLANKMIRTVMKNVKDDKVRRKIYDDMIEAFEDADCDTLCECTGIDPVFDEFFPEEDYE